MGTMRPVGRISKLFGSKGELLANLYDTFPAGFTIEEPLCVEIDGLAVFLFPERFERRGRSGALVVFADLDNDIRAGELVGMEFSVAEEVEIPEGSGRGGSPHAGDTDDRTEDGFLLEDLVGFTARLGDGYSGVIAEFIDGENPLFRVTVGQHEALIPAVEEWIVSFDPDAREIVFELPEGLLELYVD